MGTWLIISSERPKNPVRLGECDREHAETVLADLQLDPMHPGKLRLVAEAKQVKKKTVGRADG